MTFGEFILTLQTNLDELFDICNLENTLKFLKESILLGLPPLMRGTLIDDVELKFYLSLDELSEARRQQILNEEIVAETFDDNYIEIYLPVIKMKKMRNQSNFDEEEFFLTIYHELFHIFSSRVKFYKQLDKVLKGHQEDFFGITKQDVEKFLVEVKDFDVEKFIKRKDMTRCWNKKYLEECGQDEKDNGILKYIERDDLRGVIEEVFAETFAEMIIKYPSPQECLPFKKLLENLFRLPGGACC